jgi:hypothetical protein
MCLPHGAPSQEWLQAQRLKPQRRPIPQPHPPMGDERITLAIKLMLALAGFAVGAAFAIIVTL